MDYHLLPRRRTILLFTWAAGCVDAIVYMAGHVFTANMTGNAVLLGISLGTNLSIATVRSLVALLTFILGVLVGAVLVGEKSHGIPWKGVRIAVLVETMVLAMFSAVFFLPFPLSNEGMVQALIVLSAFAMGLQSAAVKRLNLPGIATTYITGTMTSMISGLVHRWGSED
ncbi:MAG TPA: YoaK family protein, partial [Candidatus Angelobacter sp.]